MLEIIRLGDIMSKAQPVYEAVTREFAERVVKRLNDRVEAIILYGSVARAESRSDSDIDILVLGTRKSDWKRVSEIAYEVDSRNNFSTLISPTFYTTEEFERNALHGSFFARRVLKEGVVLYDNGSYKRIRNKIFVAG
ncbi:MAG: nucleotidyltransferase domain-containing protein [Nitrososphaerales archaeon]